MLSVSAIFCVNMKLFYLTLIWLCSHRGHTSDILELTDSVEHHFFIMAMSSSVYFCYHITLEGNDACRDNYRPPALPVHCVPSTFFI